MSLAKSPECEKVKSKKRNKILLIAAIPLAVILLVFSVMSIIRYNNAQSAIDYTKSEFENSIIKEFEKTINGAGGFDDIVVKPVYGTAEKWPGNTYYISTHLAFESEEIGQYKNVSENSIDANDLSSKLQYLDSVYDDYDNNEKADFKYMSPDGIEVIISTVFYFDYDIYIKGTQDKFTYGVSSIKYNDDFIYTNFGSIPSSSSVSSVNAGTFTNKYGTATTVCAHNGCTNYIAPSGDTNCCTIHSRKCAQCGVYIDEDAIYCMDCIQNAIDE